MSFINFTLSAFSNSSQSALAGRTSRLVIAEYRATIPGNESLSVSHSFHCDFIRAAKDDGRNFVIALQRNVSMVRRTRASITTGLVYTLLSSVLVVLDTSDGYFMSP